MKPMIIAHRGASGYAPENTMSAFRMAADMGSDGFEFDVQMTADGVPVVIHDEKLFRTTRSKGYVNEYSFKELQTLDAGQFMGEEWKGERIPSLEEVLSEFPGLFLNIELKNSDIPYVGMEQKVISLVERYCDPENIILSSFNHSSIQTVKEIAPYLKTGVLYNREPHRVIEYANGLQASALHPNFKTLTSEKVKAFQNASLHVNTWTVNEERSLEKMVEWGVEGIITNYPDRLKSILFR